MAGPAFALAGASSGLNVLSGLFGFFSSQEDAEALESRSRLLSLEAEADVQRFAERAQAFQATQRLAFIKSGVKLEGSPLDILDESARIIAENLSAIRNRGRFEADDRRLEAEEVRARGRAGLLRGITESFTSLSLAAFESTKSTGIGRQNRKDR